MWASYKEDMMIKIKKKFLKLIIYVCFVFTLFLMEATNVGEMGLKKYSSSFEIFDMMFKYNNDFVYSALSALTEQGIHRYIKLLFVDFIFIISFCYVQYDLTKIIIKKAKEKYKMIFVFVFLRACCDIIENLLLLIILFNYPAQISHLVFLSSTFTSIKFISIGLWIISIVVIIFLNLFQKKNKKYIEIKEGE